MSILKKLRMARCGYIVMSIVFYAAGIFCIALPDLSPEAACFSCGIALTAYGIIKLIGYFSDDLFCLAFQYDLGFGLSLIVLGAIVIGLNVRILDYLQPVVGLLILLDGMLKIQTSKDARKFGLETWYQLLICAVIAGALGALMAVMAFLEKPSHILNGLAVLAEGIMNHLLVDKTVMMERIPFGEKGKEQKGF